jgi:VCBS repeat-containing protein
VVALNSAADQIAAGALIANLTFDHQGRNPTGLPRVLLIALDDGNGGTLPAASMATVAIQTVDDQPDLSSATFLTVKDMPVSGTITSSDPEAALVTLSLVSGTVRGSLSFPATAAPSAPATAAFTYTPYVGESGTDTFVVQASDGTSAPVQRTITVVIAGGAGPRPWIVSDPPMEVYEGDLLRYQVEVDGREIGGGANLAWELVGAPAGATITSTGQLTASLLWTASRGAGDHVVFSVLVRDLSSSSASVQEITVRVNARPGGGG